MLYKAGNVITYPPYRRKGLATMLIRQIIQEAVNLGGLSPST